MNTNHSFDKQNCETLCVRQSSDVLRSDHNISQVIPQTTSHCDSLETMVSTTFVTNGSPPNHDSDQVLNACKTPVNGLKDSIDGNNSQISSSVSTCSNVSTSSNGSSSGANAANHVPYITDSDTSLLPSMGQMSQSLPFPLLSGEKIAFNGTTSDGNLFITNYRIFVSYVNCKDRLPISLPIGVIETIELRDLFYLYIYTKHVRSFIISLPMGDDCTLWYKRVVDVCQSQSKLENLFCFKFFNGTKLDKMPTIFVENKHIRNCYETLSKEYRRMSFDSNIWRISDINKEFKLCSSYPRYLVVPHSIGDKDLESVANFRYSRRIPTVVWRHRKNGCVIARSSQPEVGWLGWRNSHDELLLHAIVKSCSSGDILNKKLLILDARSYTAAVANRAKGGGCECPEYYLSCEVQFMSLANIHAIRKSFHSLRYICESPADQFNWLTLLDNTKWLHNISGLMKSALIVVNAIDLEERPVLVHCSDGWDRTPQIVALAELMLDPFYRTIDGFKVLVEREWIQFGHKFADRCGNGAFSEDINERCPVFLQWLDCVHQLVLQFPCSFEFNVNFLIKLIQHTYSSLFGTFICNNMRERVDHQISETTYSVWSYFATRRQQYVNHLYVHNDQVLRSSCKAKDIIFWGDVYMPMSSTGFGPIIESNNSLISDPKANISYDSTDGSNHTNEVIKDSNIESKQMDSELNVSNNETNETESDMDTIASDKHHSLSKTRSCENIAMGHTCENHNIQTENNCLPPLRTRHCSDPNLLGTLNIADHIEWERGKCADILKYIRDLQTNGMTARSDASDRDSILNPSSRNSDNGLLEDTDLGLNSHLSMLSTETLLNNTFVENIRNCCPESSLTNNLSTKFTSTTELSSSCVQNNDITVQFDRLYDSIYSQKKKQNQNCSTPIQRQNSIDKDRDVSVNGCNGFGKHTRTPSSGCPATPNEEQSFDAFPFDGTVSHEMFDIDGHILLRDKVLVRLQHIIGQNKNEIDYLRRELYLARLALCQQVKYCNGINDESPDPRTGTTSLDFVTDNPSLDSWVDVMPSSQQNRNGFTIPAKCDKSNSFSTFNSEANTATNCNDSTLDSNQLALNQL